MMKYASAVFAFAAALTSIVGDTHDSARPGIAGITLLGWAAIVVAALSFAVILVETYRDHVKINWQAAQKAKVRRVANRQVVKALMYFLSPFRVLLTEIWQKRSGLEVDLEQLDRNPAYILGLLANPSIRADFKNVDLRAKANVYPPTLWWEYFSKHASEARELLNQAAAKYSGYLDPDALAAIEEVRSDELVCFRFPHLGELESDNKQIVPLPLTYAFGIREDLASLDVMLGKLRAVLDHSGSEERAA